MFSNATRLVHSNRWMNESFRDYSNWLTRDIIDLRSPSLAKQYVSSHLQRVFGLFKFYKILGSARCYFRESSRTPEAHIQRQTSIPKRVHTRRCEFFLGWHSWASQTFVSALLPRQLLIGVFNICLCCGGYHRYYRTSPVPRSSDLRAYRSAQYIPEVNYYTVVIKTSCLDHFTQNRLCHW